MCITNALPTHPRYKRGRLVILSLYVIKKIKLQTGATGVLQKRKSFALIIDSETMKAIEKWADDEIRSVNGQIKWILNQSLKQQKG